MHTPVPRPRAVPRVGLWPVCASLVLALAACGGGGEPLADATQRPQATSSAVAGNDGTASLQVQLSADRPALATAVQGVWAQPSFHAAPVLLAEPEGTDSRDPMASARRAPWVQRVPDELRGLATRGLLSETLAAAQSLRALRSGVGEGTTSATAGLGAQPEALSRALASGSAVVVYTPAQIRAAYGLPPLPAPGAALSAEQRAQLGAGQTLYIVSAHHNPNVAAELAAFSAKFGLPGCSSREIAIDTPLPLAPASASNEGCELAVVYSTPAGRLTSNAPSYDATWATEIALDVQWAHATAPLARIVLIEAADGQLNNLLGAIRVANAMGPGVVSMSFGSPESNYTAAVDEVFSSPDMSYVAATGDQGAGVAWPSVSPRVLAVGGTTLRYAGDGPRSETAWSGTGGGLSAYTAQPAYQRLPLPGLAGQTQRAVADVAFNADPNTGQYVALMKPGSRQISWSSLGGTSLATPQWAGLIAVANAMRAHVSRPALGQLHPALYSLLGAEPQVYANLLADVVAGSHGGCASCSATPGYDALTGLGTPQMGALLDLAVAPDESSNAAADAAPVVAPAALQARSGAALSYTVQVSAARPVDFSLLDAPPGVSISGTGVIGWASPTVGSHVFTVQATDRKTGRLGQGRVTLQVVQAGPVVSVQPLNGVVGSPLQGSIGLEAPGATSLSLAIAGAPPGMAFTMDGMSLAVSWPKPVAGQYLVKVTLTDSFGLSATGRVPVTVTAP